MATQIIGGLDGIEFIKDAFGIKQEFIQSITINASLDECIEVTVNGLAAPNEISSEEVETVGEETKYEVTVKKVS